MEAGHALNFLQAEYYASTIKNCGAWQKHRS